MQSVTTTSTPPTSPRKKPSLVDGTQSPSTLHLLSPRHPSSPAMAMIRPSCLSRSLSCKSSSSTSSTGSNKSVRFISGEPVTKVHYTYAKEVYDRAPIEVDENLAMRRCQEEEPRKWIENFYTIRSGGEDEEEEERQDENVEDDSDASDVEYAGSPSLSNAGDIPTLLRFDYTYDKQSNPLQPETASSVDSVSSLPSFVSDCESSYSVSSSCSMLADSSFPLVQSPIAISSSVLLFLPCESETTSLDDYLALSPPAAAGIKRASSPKGPSANLERRKACRRSTRSFDESDAFGCLGGF